MEKSWDRIQAQKITILLVYVALLYIFIPLHLVSINHAVFRFLEASFFHLGCAKKINMFLLFSS